MAGPGTSEKSSTLIHASLVASGDRGLLITGRSGSGKSALALQLIAMGADLVADDRVHLSDDGQCLCGAAPDTIKGQIEARHIGILTLPARDKVPVSAVVDLDEAETERLPEPQTVRLLGHAVPKFRKDVGPGAAAALFLVLKHGDVRR